MGKGFLAGIVWGAVSSLLVVVAVSLNTALPGPEAANVDAPVGSQFVRPADAPDLVVPRQDQAAAPQRPVVDLPEDAPDTSPQSGQSGPDTSSATVNAPVQQIDGLAVGPAGGSVPFSAVAVPDAAQDLDVAAVLGTPARPDSGLDTLDEALALADAAVARVETDVAPERVDVPVDVPGVAAVDLPEPQVLPAAPEPTAPLQQDAPAPDTAGDAPEPAPVAAPEPAPVAEPVEPAAPQAVTTGRLPSIAAPQVPVAPVAAPSSVFTGALARNALRLDLELGLPLFSVVLIDRTGQGLPMAEIASLPVPVAIAMDPNSNGAAQTADGYRATGHEVLVLAENMPLDGNAADLAVAMNAILAQIPSAVGVLLPPNSDLARDRAAMDQVAEILARTGHGLVVVPQGLDAAGQAAQAANVPTAEIFRVLDAEDEGVPLMTRYLDRAAFEASRDQSVVVLGTIQPDTLEALLTWIGGRRADTVAVAPISAIMLQ